MKFSEISVYDYKNRRVTVKLPDKEIQEIFVHILSGDETGFVEFKDGTRIDFDASNCRLFGYEDGAYLVSGEDDLEAWINFDFFSSRLCTYSYARQEKFSLIEI